MKQGTTEQLLVFFSDLLEDGIILDFTLGGDLESDILEGGVLILSDLQLDPPSEDNLYGIWMWEGSIGLEEKEEFTTINYVGGWRRLTTEEMVNLINSERIIEDFETEEEIPEIPKEMLN